MFEFGRGWITVRNGRTFSSGPITAFAWCNDCNANVGYMGEWCMLKASVWSKAWPGTAQNSSRAKMPMKHFLCIECVEKRIGRKLTRTDFDMRSKHNKPSPKRQFPMSRRLRNRLGLKK